MRTKLEDLTIEQKRQLLIDAAMNDVMQDCLDFIRDVVIAGFRGFNSYDAAEITATFDEMLTDHESREDKIYFLCNVGSEVEVF